MNIKAIVIYGLISCITFLLSPTSYAQDTTVIKEMIVKDMVLLNTIYHSKIISDLPQKNIVIDDKKIVDSFYSIPYRKLIDSPTSISIIKLQKVSFDLFLVKVHFNVNFKDLDSRDLEFEYLLFQSNLEKSEYYQIDGFLVNDIFLLERSQIHNIGIWHKGCKRAAKLYYAKKRMDKCRKYFKSTIMDKLNLKSQMFDRAPIFNSSAFGFSQVVN